MLERELDIEENKAIITVKKHSGFNSMFISCNGFETSLNELEALSLFANGLTLQQVADKLHLTKRTVRNRLSEVMNRNSSLDCGDYHHYGAIEKAKELQLIYPIYLEGLRAIRDSL